MGPNLLLTESISKACYARLVGCLSEGARACRERLSVRAGGDAMLPDIQEYKLTFNNALLLIQNVCQQGDKTPT